MGYHYFIKRDGTVQKGRDLERIPIAQKGHNTGTIAICAHGHREFTDSQFDALVKLCKDMNEKLPKSQSYLLEGRKRSGVTYDLEVYCGGK